MSNFVDFAIPEVISLIQDFHHHLKKLQISYVKLVTYMPQLTETPKASQSFKANPTENPLSELGIAFCAKFASLAVFQYHSNPFLVFICASIQLGGTEVHILLCNFSSTLVHEPICHYNVYIMPKLIS